MIRFLSLRHSQSPVLDQLICYYDVVRRWSSLPRYYSSVAQHATRVLSH